ncbi:MAG TPA: hypothetical protein VII43_08055 [Opitutaceae bacterium]
MEKVPGIGGFFFRARSPQAPGRRYEEHLAITLTPGIHGSPGWRQEAGTTGLEPFAGGTDHPGDRPEALMIGFRVRDLKEIEAQPRLAGIEISVDPERYPNGTFAWLKDLEGNPVRSGSHARGMHPAPRKRPKTS